MQEYQTTRLVENALAAGGFTVGRDDGLGDISGVAAIGTHHYHGHTVTVYPNVPLSWDHHREAQAALADSFARLLYEAGLCPASSRGWKPSRLILVPIDDSLDD